MEARIAARQNLAGLSGRPQPRVRPGVCFPWEERVKERPAFINYPAGLAIWGGVPIIHQNECVGAIGVSGVQSQDDEKVANAGVAALS